jgi:hypothetical protein
MYQLVDTVGSGGCQCRSALWRPGKGRVEAFVAAQNHVALLATQLAGGAINVGVVVLLMPSPLLRLQPLLLPPPWFPPS